MRSLEDKMDEITKLTDKEIETFDRMLAEACLEKCHVLQKAVIHWDRKAAKSLDGTVAHAKYCEWRDAAAEKLAKGLQRESKFIACLRVRCEDPHCEGHRALLIGIA